MNVVMIPDTEAVVKSVDVISSLGTNSFFLLMFFVNYLEFQVPIFLSHYIFCSFFLNSITYIKRYNVAELFGFLENFCPEAYGLPPYDDKEEDNDENDDEDSHL